MSYSYASLDEAWNQPKTKHGRKSSRARMTPSPSPSPSSNGTTSGDTIVISDDSMSASASPSPSFTDYSSSPSPSPSMESFYSDDEQSASPSPYVSPSPSPSQNTIASNPREYRGIITRGRGSPITALDEDDFNPQQGQVDFVKSLPGRPPQSYTQTPSQVIGSSTISGIGGGQGKEEKMMRHILRIQDDVREMLKNGGSRTGDSSQEKEYRFPFVETGLFLSVGLFVLLAMNLMLRMGKQHVTYRFNFAD